LGLTYLSKARFLQASTSEVYGDPAVHPQKESYWGNVNCYGPRACYDEGKRAAETIIYEYQRVAQLDARIVRIFNTYGPNMAENDGRVVSNFIMQAIQDKPITIYGEGSQTRSFCYVEDTVEAILRVLEGPYNQPLNVGNPKENTVLELAGAIIKLTKSKSPIISMTLPMDDPRQRCPDISKIKELYWWVPNTDLEEGLRKTIAYFKALQLKK
jgi:UDP-glucuronate decarboxylase